MQAVIAVVFLSICTLQQSEDKDTENGGEDL
jgi:hypothetical protein